MVIIATPKITAARPRQPQVDHRPVGDRRARPRRGGAAARCRSGSAAVQSRTRAGTATNTSRPTYGLVSCPLNSRASSTKNTIAIAVAMAAPIRLIGLRAADGRSKRMTDRRVMPSSSTREMRPARRGLPSVDGYAFIGGLRVALAFLVISAGVTIHCADLVGGQLRADAVQRPFRHALAVERMAHRTLLRAIDRRALVGGALARPGRRSREDCHHYRTAHKRCNSHLRLPLRNPTTCKSITAVQFRTCRVLRPEFLQDPAAPREVCSRQAVTDAISSEPKLPFARIIGARSRECILLAVLPQPEPGSR